MFNKKQKGLKSICTYILLIALTLQSFYRSVMVLEYEIHLPDYIAQCINKDRPQIHCNGQCVFMKKIREEEQKETKKNLQMYERNALYMHKERVLFTMHLPEEDHAVNHFLPYLTDYRFNFTTAVFRPPISLLLTSRA